MLSLGPRTWHLTGDVLTAVTVAGVRLQVLGERARSEMLRRVDTGPKPGELTRPQLAAMSRMPELTAVPWREIDFETRLELDGLPLGAIAVDADTATRVWRPPVHVAAVCSMTRPWERGLAEVSMFATVAPRVLRLPAAPSSTEQLRAQAERLGVGVFIDADPLVALTRPPSTKRVSDDARRWEVAEAAYLALSGRATATPMTGAVATEI